MNREIKFRGKSYNSGSWLYGNLTVPDIPSLDYYMYYDRKPRKVYASTIGQYTGLKDKNGTEIYEGDIVLCEGLKAVVLWDEKLAIFALKSSFEDKVGSNPLGEWKNIEAIGNIHDNTDKK